MINKTFAECAADPVSTIYADWEQEGYRCLVLRGPVSVNAYIGVKPGHMLYGIPYDDIPIKCHGGLTFAHKGDDSPWPIGYYWIGWDYAHSGDTCFYDLNRDKWFDEHSWTPDEIMVEVSEVIEQLKRVRISLEQVKRLSID